MMSQRSGRAVQVIALATLVSAGGCDPVESRAPIDVASLGPQVGERVPDFRLVDQAGQVRTLQSILGPRGAILLFHRSADW